MAKLFCVSYDLSKDGDYSKLIDKIKDSSDWWHQSGSVWFISSEDSAVEIRDSLKQFLQPSDKLFVFNVKPCAWAGTGFSKEEYDWFKDNNKDV